MSRITISSSDAEKLAKSFNDLIGPKGLDRIRRKSVNAVGADIRKKTRIIGPVIYSTSATALKVQGKAASPGTDNPAYRLSMATTIPVSKLKAKARKLTRRRGRASLSILLPGGNKIAFRSVRREGPIIRLLAAGPLAERSLGGVFTNPKVAFERHPELKQLRRDAGKDLAEAVATQITAHLKERRS